MFYVAKVFIKHYVYACHVCFCDIERERERKKGKENLFAAY